MIFGGLVADVVPGVFSISSLSEFNTFFRFHLQKWNRICSFTETSTHGYKNALVCGSVCLLKRHGVSLRMCFCVCVMNVLGLGLSRTMTRLSLSALYLFICLLLFAPEATLRFWIRLGRTRRTSRCCVSGCGAYRPPYVRNESFRWNC